ncbi:MAG: TMEM14 family protein [Chthoniobacterales bacterium]
MNSITIVLAVASLIVLVAGLYVWRLTTSKPTLLNILISSAFLLLSSYSMTDVHQKDFGFALAFFAAMLCTGRAGAFLWRSKKEPELTMPAYYMSGISLVTIISTILAYKGR